MLRSKSLDRDSYNSGDWFNRFTSILHNNHAAVILVFFGYDFLGPDRVCFIQTSLWYSSSIYNDFTCYHQIYLNLMRPYQKKRLTVRKVSLAFSFLSGWISAMRQITGVLAFLPKERMKRTGHCKLFLFLILCNHDIVH